MNFCDGSNETWCSQTDSLWTKIWVFTIWFVQKKDVYKVLNGKPVDCREMSNSAMEISVKCIFLHTVINDLRSQVTSILIKHTDDDQKCRNLCKCMIWYGKNAEVPTELWKMHKKKTPQFFQLYSGKNSIANIFGAKTIGNLIIWYEKNNWPTCADMFVHISLN